MNEPTRPILRWHGGKWRLAPWIISHFPTHRTYVEPFGGAASVLLRKTPSYAEVWNDLDEELVNLFPVLRDKHRADELIRRLELTPFSRSDFNEAYRPARSQLERARKLIIRSFMGHGSDGASGIYRTGFRANSNRTGTTPAHDWVGFPQALAFAAERLRPVVLERRPAVRVMRTHDSADTLHYVDPPYAHETRARANRRPDNGGVYRHELTTDEHIDLLKMLKTLEGMVALSGYPSELYDEALPGWRKVSIRAMADGALERVEVLWLNPALVERYGSGPLFEVAA
jgi:DNA adenine methylase